MKKMKMKKQIIALSLLGVMVFSGNVFAYDTGTGTVKVPKESKLVVAKTGIKRTGAYNYVMTKANSVYPTTEGATDNYTQCYAQWFTKDGNAITAKTLLTEGNLRRVTVKNGYINQTGVTLKFAGHDPKLAAKVEYYYNGL